MALLCFLERETNGSEESWERPDFEILLSDHMAAQREVWPIESLGILFINNWNVARSGCEYSVGSCGLGTSQGAEKHPSQVL